MANTLNTTILVSFASPAIRSLKWAANASATRLESAQKAAQAFPTRPLGKTKEGSGAHKAVKAFTAMLTERGVAVPPVESIAPSTILGAFGITDLSLSSLKAVAAVCKEALEQRREQAKAEKPEAKPASVNNVLGTKAPAKTEAPKAVEAPTAIDCACPKCGDQVHVTKAKPFCQCGTRCFKQRPGRKAKASKSAEKSAAPAAASVANVVNG